MHRLLFFLSFIEMPRVLSRRILPPHSDDRVVERRGVGTGGEEREGEGRMKTASRGKVEWNGRTVGNRCNVHRFRVVLNGRNCRVRTKILLVSLPLPPLFRIIKETTTKMIFLLPSFGSQRNRTLANFWNVSSFVPFVESNPFFVRFSWNKFHLKKNLF